MVRLPHNKGGNQVEVTVYKITGRQLFFNVGRSLCEECDSAVAAVSKAVEELKGIAIQFKVEPWLNSLPLALAKGAYHPPITLVDGRIVSQGVIPDVGLIKRAITEAAGRRGIGTGLTDVEVAKAPHARQATIGQEGQHL